MTSRGVATGAGFPSRGAGGHAPYRAIGVRACEPFSTWWPALARMITSFGAVMTFAAAGASISRTRMRMNRAPIRATVTAAAAAAAAALRGRRQRRLGLELAVPQERVVRAAFHRPVVQPRAAVIKAPERDAREYAGVAVLRQHLEQFAVALGELLLHVGGQAVLVRVESLLLGRADVRAAAPLRGSTSTSSSVIMTFTPSAAYAAIASSISFADGESRSQWPWMPTPSSRTPAALSSLISRSAFGALVRLLDVVVVVVQLDVGVGRLRELERLDDVIVADRLAGRRVAEVLARLVADRLVDDVPADHLARRNA